MVFFIIFAQKTSIMENEVFATAIEIRKVRHLENIKIEISETERKHLILTGKNGSGKTSVLEAVRDFLIIQTQTKLQTETTLLSEINTWKLALETLKTQLSNTQEMAMKKNLDITIENYQNSINVYEKQLDLLNRLKINFSKNLGDFFKELVLFYAKVQRQFKPEVPKTNEAVNLLEYNTLDKNASSQIVKYLLLQEMKMLKFFHQKREKEAQEIQQWLDNFRDILREIFEDNNLVFESDLDQFNYTIKAENNTKIFDFNTLSDGFASYVNIVTEILLRMEGMKVSRTDLQGIVLIDEIETHLHIDLQKKILPFLTTFFPKIQFIVTTHSPFVLNSIPNAVVFDLENRQRLENIEDISAMALVKHHFQVKNDYSQLLETKIETYESLVEKTDLTVQEITLLANLETELSQLSPLLSPEMYLRYKSSQAKL